MHKNLDDDSGQPLINDNREITMTHEDKLINEIIKSLKHELPEKYLDHLTDFEELVGSDLLRASYNILDELQRKKDWSPSLHLQNLIRDYQIVF